MTTIIIGTNSAESVTSSIAVTYEAILQDHDEEYRVFDMKSLPRDIIRPEMYYEKNEQFEKLQEEYLYGSDKFIVLIPEYNGGIPGIFKLMIDVSNIDKAWKGKKACIAGISSGRAGNLRGLDTLTNIFQYLSVDVFHDKLPISRINQLIDDEGRLTDEYTIQAIGRQVAGFMAM